MVNTKQIPQLPVLSAAYIINCVAIFRFIIFIILIVTIGELVICIAVPSGAYAVGSGTGHADYQSGCKGLMMASRDPNIMTIIAYGLVSLPIGLIGVPMAIYIAPFYSGELGLSLATVGTMLMLSRVTDFITDPVIGFLSDTWRPKVGRRKVWLIIGTVVFMAGVFFLFRPGKDVSAVYLLASVSLVYLGYTTLQLPYNAWGAELSPNYHVRTKINGAAKFFDTAGLVVSTIIPTLVLAKAGASAGDVMGALSIFFLIALPICASIAFFSVPEAKSHVPATRLKFKKTASVILQNKPMTLITLAVFAGTVAEVFRQTVTFFYATQVIGVENIGTVYVYYFATALTMIPVWSWVAKKTEKHRALAIALVVIFITNIGMFFLEDGQTTLFIGFFILKGACYGALAMLPGAMIADCADLDTARTGEKRQGVFFAVNAMVQKLGFALGQGLPLTFLGFIGFDPAGTNGPNELFGLIILYSIVPAGIVFVAILAILPYSLNATRHRSLQLYIKKREQGADPERPKFI